MSETYLLVALGGERYALPIGNVLEVGAIAETTPLPGTPPEVLGLQNIRGEVVPLLDLASVLGIEGSSAANAVVVVDDRGRRAALAVDALLGVDPLEKAKERVEAPPLRSSVLVGGALVGVLDTAALLDESVGAAAG